MTALLCATADGLVTLDEAGATIAVDFLGREVVSVDAADDAIVVAIAGGGVVRYLHGTWTALGLEGHLLWSVVFADHHVVLAGVEPAALWRLGDGEPRELAGLDAVEGHAEWHSPWGPADLSTIVAENARVIVGVEIGGVAVSHDAGESWEARNTGLFDDVHRVVANGPVLHATTGLGCFRSTDEGRRWYAVNDGIDRAYTLGLVRVRDALVCGAASGPPTLWEAGGPEAALFRADATAEVVHWTCVHEGFAGAVERQGLAAHGELVVAGTTAGEILVSHDAGRTFTCVRDDLAPVNSVAIA